MAAGKSARGLAQSRTLRDERGTSLRASVVDCASPLAPSVANVRVHTTVTGGFDEPGGFRQSPAPMRFTLILLLALVSLVASGADNSFLFRTNRTLRHLSLDDCVRHALERSPRIKVRRFDPRIARFELMAARGVYDPIFGLDYAHLDNVSAGRFNANEGLVRQSSAAESDTFAPVLGGYLPSGMEYTFSGNFSHSRGQNEDGRFEDYSADAAVRLEQPLLKNFWIDGPRTDIQILRRDLKISELAVEEEVRRVVRDVQVVYYDLVAARENVFVNETNVLLAALLLDTSMKEVAAGRRAAVETNQPLSEFMTAQADLIEAQQQHRAFENLLKSLVTDDYQSWLNTRIEPTDKLITVPERLDWDAMAESWASAYNKRPDLRQLGLESEKLELNRRLSRNQVLPEFNLVGGYGRSAVSRFSPLLTNSIPNPTPPPFFFQTVVPQRNAHFNNAVADLRDGLNPRWNVGFVLSYPLGNRSARYGYRATKEAAKQLEAEMQLLKHQILVEVQDAMEAALAARERISARWQAAQAADIALRAERDRVVAGTSTFVDASEVQNTYIQALSAHIEALAIYNKALAELYYLDGTILERNKISVQSK